MSSVVVPSDQYLFIPCSKYTTPFIQFPSQIDDVSAQSHGTRWYDKNSDEDYKQGFFNLSNIYELGFQVENVTGLTASVFDPNGI